MKKLKVVILNRDNNKVEIISIKDKDIPKYVHENLNIKCFDIISRKIGNKFYDIFIDDNGLLKNGKIKGSGICLNASEIIVGNLLITKFNLAEEEYESLNEEDIDEIIEKLFICKKELLIPNYFGEDIVFSKEEVSFFYEV